MDSGIDLRKKGSTDRYRFDYKGMHRYLVTFTTYRSVSVFTEKSVVLRLLDLLRESCWKHHFDVYAYCCLPDRLVMIVRGKTEHADMKAFIAAFRSHSSGLFQESLGHPLWKRTYTERVLRKREDSKVLASEVFQLPVQAGLVSRAEDFAFRGSFVLHDRKRS